MKAEKLCAVAWQPIETAPRDNTHMLLLARFIDGKRVGEIDFDGIWDWETDGWEYGNNRSWFWNSAYGRVDEPTHWMYQPDWYDAHPASATAVYVQADLDAAEARATKLASRLCVDAPTREETANRENKPTNHTDADVPARGVESRVSTGESPSAVGVPDLIHRLKKASTIVGGLVGSVIDEASEELAALQEQEQNFHMEYRMKCDVETKQQAATIAEMRELLEEAHKMLYSIGCSPEGIDLTIAEAEALQAGITNLLERTK